MEKARWIWTSKTNKEDEYCDFKGEFSLEKAEASVDVSCDGDYVLYVNGVEVASNQYGDYPHFKVYDSVDVSAYVKRGINHIALTVWHFGVDTQRYINAQAGVIFEVKSAGKVVCFSSADTLSRESRAYKSGMKKKITPQLGCTFFYDANKEDGWKTENAAGFDKSVEVCKTYDLNTRPNKKLELTDVDEGKVVYKDEKRVVFDMGKETVGLCGFSFVAEDETLVTGCWSERVEEGFIIPRIIGARDFSFEYVAKKGANEYRNPFLRFGCRYVELNFDKPVSEAKAWIVRQEYPVEEVKYKFDNDLDKRIYELSVRTLRLCMMEHYVDCPWREQCLYVYDSRNQMLFGYKAFKGGNAEYVKSNLLLISKDNREDGLLEICYPSGCKYPIPSFSLYYFLSLREYLDNTGDKEFVRSVFAKATSLLGAFESRIKDGLLTDFDDTYWSFYDWTVSNEGRKGAKKCNGLLNILYVLAVNNYDVICQKLGEENRFANTVKVVKENIEKAFFDEKVGLYSNDAGSQTYTALTQALAVRALDMDADRAASLCEKLVKSELENTTLSFKPFVYDALLATDAKYEDYVLQDIRDTYSKMLDEGATACWETANGYKDFGNAGSLCHGWSAIAAYYYVVLGVAKA